ncbi:rhomboid family intramembrane serine protease [Calothrix sp. 336/3]|uniref:rhomboid family intramembrane serine protease n=1 Tax=Calothrix sp. 336/3 TaxID=1337936 RepID=UPI0004E41F07|nr:rhomboid family intramembrane serine protease [Calothrix sp. 336/3]AKG23945.1 rhomboid family protein [Calothrix sp. 336/3]
MIPISDYLELQKKPIITYCVLGMNLFLFLAELRMSITGDLNSFVSNWGLTPAILSTAIAQLSTGNLAAGVYALLRSGSILTAMFIHGSFSQILGNSIYIWVFGKSLENFLGHRKYLLFYLLCGSLTGIAQIIIEPNLTTPLVGANGAIAAILGAYIYRYSHIKIDTIFPLVIAYVPLQLPAYFYGFWWFVQQLFYGIGSLNIPGANSGTIGYWAHGMGLVIGVIILRIFAK